MARDVCILIPTLNRPDSLARAVRSAKAQRGAEARLKEIVVVDNDPERSAAAVVTALQTGSTVPVVYVSAPRPGVATARNAGLAATRASLIAFLDDDEEASPDWLAELLRVQAQTCADVVFGPIRGRASSADGHWTQPYLEWFFGRHGPSEDGLISTPFGCGNSLMVRKTALPGPAPFETAMDQSGGEDDALFSDLAARGGRFAWASRAWVDEHAPAHRARLGYALGRAFAYGQGPSQTAAREGDGLGVARWMAVGAAQLALLTPWVAVATLIGGPRRAWAYDRWMRAAGKLFWFSLFERPLYGESELLRARSAAQTA